MTADEIIAFVSRLPGVGAHALAVRRHDRRRG